MIQISNLLSMITETPAKTAGVGHIDAGFADLLAGELEGDAAAGGKVLPVGLPEGGKTLPVAASIELTSMTGGATSADGAKPVLADVAGSHDVAIGAIAIPSIRLAAAARQEIVPADEVEPEGEAPRQETHALVASKIVAVELKSRARADAAERTPVADASADPETEDDQEDASELIHGPTVLLDLPATDPVEPVAALMPAPDAEAVHHADVVQPEAKRAGLRLFQVDQSAAHASIREQAEAVMEDSKLAGTAKDSAPKDDGTRSPRGAAELRFELSRASGEARFERSVTASSQAANPIRMPLAAASQIVIPEQAIAGQVADASALPGSANSASTSFVSSQALKPHEFNVLVDRLVEARETARSGSVDVAVMHADFGEVSLRFRQDASGLSVSMSNNDPEFARAVGAATQADGAQMGDNAGQGARRDDNMQNSNAFSRSGTGGEWGQSSAHANMSDGGQQNTRDGGAGEQRAGPSRAAGSEDRTGMDGIYA